MNILSINHFAILTNKMEETIAFYKVALGFTYDETIEDANGIPHAFIRKGDACQIEVIESETGFEKRASFDHLALDVEDVLEAEKYLKKAGIQIKEHSILKPFNTHMLSIVDPNGIVIALREDIK